MNFPIVDICSRFAYSVTRVLWTTANPEDYRMTPAAQRDLSKAEWKVMKIVWELRKAMAREVYTIAGRQQAWTPATVKTILKRLVDKGYLSATPVGNGFVYRPAQSALSALQSAADRLLA